LGFIAHTFTSPYLGHKPKVKVATIKKSKRSEEKCKKTKEKNEK
jgi:hypothetical protein